MKELKITKDNALKAWKEGTTELKKAFENLFGSEHFKVSTDICDHINSFADAFEMHPPTPEQRKVLDSGYAPAVAFVSMEIFTKAMNTNPITKEVWRPDYSDGNRKWYIWWKYTSGVGFRFGGSSYVDDGTGLGSRLVFETEEKMRHASNCLDFVAAWNIYSPGKL